MKKRNTAVFNDPTGIIAKLTRPTTPIEVPSRNGLSSFPKESKYFACLFNTNLREERWGKREEVCIDVRSGKPYWLLTQYDGCVFAQTWLIEKRELTYQDVAECARAVSAEVSAKYKDISENSWKSYIPEEKLKTE